MDVEKMIRETVLGVLMTALTGFSGCLAGGCKMTTGEKVEFGFKQSTAWGFYHDTSATGVIATVELSVPSIEEWIMGPPEPESTDGDTP